MDVLETLNKLEKIVKRQEKDIVDLQIKFEELKLIKTSTANQLEPFSHLEKQLENNHTELQNNHMDLLKQINEIKAALTNTPVKSVAIAKDNSYSEIIKNMNQLSIEYEELKKLLHSDKWPPAVDPSLICNISSDQDKKDRAEGIIDLIIDVHLEGLKFLDFGCGEGHVVMKALEQNPQFSIGFDIEKFDAWDKWPKNEKALLTTKWEEVEKNKPYNVVLIFDVLDHMQGSEKDVIERLKAIKSLLAPRARIYVRCHPWCSIHGTHLYKQLNKAWIHLVFEDHELEEMGYKNEYTRKVIHPAASYGSWFKEAGLTIDTSSLLKKPVSPFFNQNLIAKRIKSRWKESPNPNLREGKIMPHPQMEQEFLDFVLR